MYLKARKNTLRFYYHYHKAESKRQGRNVLTVHWGGKCHPVNDILCLTACETHTQKHQPRCVLRGWATEVNFKKVKGSIVAVIHK